MKKHKKRDKTPVYDNEIEFEKLRKFEAASSDAERMSIYKTFLADDYRVAALECIPKEKRYKYIPFIKSVDSTMEVINKFEDIDEKRAVLYYVTSTLKGNSDKYLRLLAQAGCRVASNQEMSVIKLNNLNAISIDLLSDIQKNVIDYGSMKFKLNEESFDDTEYTFAELSAIMIKMEELTAGIDPNASEMDKFATIYERMTNSITYDHDCIRRTDKLEARRKKEWNDKDYTAAGKTTGEIKQERREAAGLYGGLVNGKAICAGYAMILHEALQYVGIKSKYLEGYPLDGTHGHAWNQVKIDGKWYNVDSTWDAGNLRTIGYWKYALLDDKTFRRSHGKYERMSTKKYPCKDPSNQIIVPGSLSAREGGARDGT